MDQEASPTADELLGTICHDLKEPLASIVMGSSFLLRELPDEAESGTRARRMAEAIHRAANRMNRLLSDYHELSRLERGSVSLERMDCDAGALLAATAERYASAASEAGIAIDRAGGDAVPLRCDRERIIDAIGKLVSNALRATPPGGTITLAAAKAGSTVEIEVSDTGSGVPSDVLPHLFDYRWLATRRARHGAGLGLGLARRTVEAHGGELRVDTAEGRGSTFTIALPMDDAPQSSSGPEMP